MKIINKTKLVILSMSIILSSSLFAQEESSPVLENNEVVSPIENQQLKEQKKAVPQSPPVRLMNYQTREKELIMEPDNLTREDSLKFIPPLKESVFIFDLYLGEGFSVIDSIRYTHVDIIELYKDYKKEKTTP